LRRARRQRTHESLLHERIAITACCIGFDIVGVSGASQAQQGSCSSGGMIRAQLGQ
jgi:hypothetical protein